MKFLKRVFISSFGNCFQNAADSLCINLITLFYCFLIGVLLYVPHFSDSLIENVYSCIKIASSVFNKRIFSLGR